MSNVNNLHPDRSWVQILLGFPPPLPGGGAMLLLIAMYLGVSECIWECLLREGRDTLCEVCECPSTGVMLSIAHSDSRPLPPPVPTIIIGVSLESGQSCHQAPLLATNNQPAALSGNEQPTCHASVAANNLRINCRVVGASRPAFSLRKSLASGSTSIADWCTVAPSGKHRLQRLPPGIKDCIRSPGG